MRLLLTRPEPGAKHSAGILRARGHDVLVAPLLRIEAITNAELGPPPWAGILVSSANAARAIASHARLQELLALPVLAVGERTAEVARATGFANVRSVDGTAADLARAAASFASADIPLLYLAGADRARDLAADLGVRKLHTAVVYDAVKTTAFPPSVTQALAAGRLDGVLHGEQSGQIVLDGQAGGGGPLRRPFSDEPVASSQAHAQTAQPLERP